jgi:hypothetical protein
MLYLSEVVDPLARQLVEALVERSFDELLGHLTMIVIDRCYSVVLIPLLMLVLLRLARNSSFH